MPQSLSSVIVHAVFSTGERHPFFEDAFLRGWLHAHLAEVSNRLSCKAIKMGGIADHVHVLASLGRSTATSTWIKELKRVSSIEVKSWDRSLANFTWQAGYGVFSVSAGNVAMVKAYIEQQEEHHRHRSFKDEYLDLLREHGMAWDERYVWD